jgi:hypothetical protein
MLPVASADTSGILPETCTASARGSPACVGMLDFEHYYSLRMAFRSLRRTMIFP